jgi:protein TonB
VGFKSLEGKDFTGSGLLPALTLSVVLHSLVLWPAANPRLVSQAGQMPLAATLRAPEVPAATVAGERSPRVSEGQAASKAVRAAPPPKAPGALTVDAVPTAAEAAPAVAAGQAAAPAGQGIPAASSGEAAVPDADGLRAYRIGLAREARSHRRYPPLARERGWSGTAEIEVDVSRQGLARQILLARSSGHEVLDREALSMMSRAARSASLPDSLRGRDFAVRLPVVFDLADPR